jgi:hypothetical protein
MQQPSMFTQASTVPGDLGEQDLRPPYSTREAGSLYVVVIGSKFFTIVTTAQSTVLSHQEPQ